jgi:cyclopropane fatty-acyl-phospholipid synthase-like methyltransferase
MHRLRSPGGSLLRGAATAFHSTAIAKQRALLQVITIPDSRYEAYCATSDFIREHIFPGGHLPSLSAMTACAAPSHLVAVQLQDIGQDYALSLRAWRRRWMARWHDIRALGYSDTFMRKCAALAPHARTLRAASAAQASDTPRPHSRGRF